MSIVYFAQYWRGTFLELSSENQECQKGELKGDLPRSGSDRILAFIFSRACELSVAGAGGGGPRPRLARSRNRQFTSPDIF
jgi:hypothetical protein